MIQSEKRPFWSKALDALAWTVKVAGYVIMSPVAIVALAGAGICFLIMAPFALWDWASDRLR